MTKKIKFLVNILAGIVLASTLTACSNLDPVKELKLTEDYEQKSFLEDGIGVQSVYKYEDGDTVYFGDNSNYYKVRFLGADTPETIGDLEPFGKKASSFTEERLIDAKTIVVESTKIGDKAELDSYNRYLGFIWYQPKNKDEFINLNLELVRNGLADLRDTPRYTEYFERAFELAKKEKLGIHSSGDPDFSKDIHDVTIKDLQENFDAYLNKRVRFTGYVTERFREADDTGESIYAEEIQGNEKYRVKIYKHTVDDKIYYVGNKSTFIGYAVDTHGIKRITGITLANRDKEYSKVLHSGYYLQLGTKILSDCQNINDNLYNDLTIENIQIQNDLLAITGSALRRGADNYPSINPKAKVTINVPLKDDAESIFKVGDKITVRGYSKAPVSYMVNEFSIDVLSISDISIVK